MSANTMTKLLSPLVEGLGKGMKLPDNLPNLIQTDSRKIKPGQWFLPIVGKNLDGHRFIHAALERGAIGFFYQKEHCLDLDTKTLDQGIAVTDTLRFFQSLASSWRRQFPKLKLIAITGSSGKTTVKEMVTQILCEDGKVLATQGSFNNEVGVPITLCRLTPEHNYAVIEMGARHQGDIDFLIQLADPELAVVLNIGTAHVGAFGSAENIRKAKSEMIISSATNSTAIVPGSDTQLLALAKKHHQTYLSFGESIHDNVRITKTIIGKNGRMTVDVVIDSHPVSIDFPVYHLAYPINIAASCAIAHAFKLSPKDIKRGLEKYISIKGRYAISLVGETVVIDDTYNANPDSMAMGLRSVAESFDPDSTMFVLGDMLELGSESLRFHQEIGALCSQLSPRMLVAVGRDARYYGKGAEKQGYSPECIVYCDNWEVLVAKFSQLPPCDTIFAKGSRGVQLDKFVDYLLETRT